MRVIHFNSLILIALLAHVLPSADAKKGKKAGGVRAKKHETKKKLNVDPVNVGSCQERLDFCLSTTGGRSPPIKEWVRSITDMFGDDPDSAAGSLLAVLTSASDTSFQDLMGVTLLEEDEIELSFLASNLTASQVDPPTVPEVPSSVTLTNILFTVEFVINGLLHMYGFREGTSLKPITELVTMVRRILTTIPDGSDKIFEVLMTEVITYVTNMIVFVAEANTNGGNNDKNKRRYLGDTDELSECVPRAMECEFNQMLLTVVPSAVGDLFLAKSFADAKATESRSSSSDISTP